MGVTNDLARRIAEHKAGVREGFTKKYNVHKLVHFETYPDVAAAIVHEEQLKAGSRAKKLALVNMNDPFGEELAGLKTLSLRLVALIGRIAALHSQ